MFILLGAIFIVVGTLLALSAKSYPERQRVLETWSGGLLMGGLACLGLAFPMI